MTIALCLSGVPRTFLHTAPTLKTYFQNKDVDIYLHLWRGEVEAVVQEQLRAVYQPKDILLTDRPDAAAGKAVLAQRFGERPNPFSFDMFYAIGQGIKAVPTGVYTHLVRARYDSVFDGVCPDEVFDAGDKTIVVPDNFTPPKGCNDQLAVGTEAALRTYGGMYDWLTQHVGDQAALPDALFAANPTEFRPEQGLLAYLSHQGFSVAQAPLRVTLLREADLDKPFADLPQDVNQGINVSYEAWKALRDKKSLGGPL